MESLRLRLRLQIAPLPHCGAVPPHRMSHVVRPDWNMPKYHLCYSLCAVKGLPPLFSLFRILGQGFWGLQEEALPAAQHSYSSVKEL